MGAGTRHPVSGCPPSWRVRVPPQAGVAALLTRTPAGGHPLTLNGGRTHSPAWVFASGSWGRWFWKKGLGGYISLAAEPWARPDLSILYQSSSPSSHSCSGLPSPHSPIPTKFSTLVQLLHRGQDDFSNPRTSLHQCPA